MTRLRTGFLSDQSVLDRCPEENSIPFNKMNLAARSGAKISFPQKAGFMYQNLPIPHAQKESLINEFVLRSQKQLPLKISAMQYSTLSLDKVGALTDQTQNGNYVSKDIFEALMKSLKDQQQLNTHQQQLNTHQQQLYTQSQNQLKVSKYTSSFLSLSKNHQVAVLNKFIGDNRDQEASILTAFGASSLLGLPTKLVPMSKATMTNNTMQAVENILNDPNQTIILDDYFSESALASFAP